jgi:hypothetical protein
LLSLPLLRTCNWLPNVYVTVRQSYRIWPRFSKSRIQSTYTLQRTYFLHINKVTLRPQQRAFPIAIVNLLRQEYVPMCSDNHQNQNSFSVVA